MSLFDRFQRTPNAATNTQMGVGNPMQLVQQIRANPAAMLKQRGLTIPEGMSDPQQIIQHLVQSGQVPNAKYQQAMQAAQMMGRR